MILTDKALEDFNLFLSDKYGKFKVTEFQTSASAPIYECFLDEIELPPNLENALIIEFFDEKGVWENIFYEVYIDSTPTTKFSEILNKAIQRANEIYNNNK